MSRIESGHMKFDLRPLSLNQVAESLETMVAADVKKKQLDFAIEKENITDDLVLCDRRGGSGS